MSTLLASLLLLSVTLCRGKKTNPSQNIEIDLVFPRNDTAYAPTDYFPIVFAVQNAATAWPLGVQIGVDIRPSHPTSGEEGGDTFNVGGDNGSTSGNATADPSLLIHATNLTNIVEGQFFIVWNSYLRNTCTDKGQDYASDTMHISFNISRSAAAPDIAVAVDNCASQSSLIDVDRNSNTSIIGENGKRCPFKVISKTGTGGGNLCGLKPLAQTIAANVSRAMCVAENGTRACESTAALRLIHPGLGVNSLLLLVASISVLCLSL